MSEQATLYEAMYIVDATLEEEQQQEAVAAVEAAIAEVDGQLENTLVFGHRKLAYEIAGHTEGLYMISYFRGSGATVQNLAREMNLLESIVRGTVVVANPEAIYREQEPVPAAAEPAEPVEAEEPAEAVESAEVEESAEAEPTAEPEAEEQAEEPVEAIQEPVAEPTDDQSEQDEERTEPEPTQ